MPTILSTVLGLSLCLDGVCLGVCTERHDPIGGILFHKNQKIPNNLKINDFKNKILEFPGNGSGIIKKNDGGFLQESVSF